jgi:hypothetical protein
VEKNITDVPLYFCGHSFTFLSLVSMVVHLAYGHDRDIFSIGISGLVGIAGTHEKKGVDSSDLPSNSVEDFKLRRE